MTPEGTGHHGRLEFDSLDAAFAEFQLPLENWTRAREILTPLGITHITIPQPLSQPECCITVIMQHFSVWLP